MKKIKILGVLILLATIVTAQPGSKGANRKQHIHMLDSMVDLSDEQKAEIQVIQKSYNGKMAEARKSGDHESLKGLHMSMQKEVHSVLNAEQKEKLRQHKMEKMANMKAMHEEIRQLNQERIRPVMSEKRKEFDQQLTDEEKAVIHRLRKQMRTRKEQHETDSMMMFGPGERVHIMHHFPEEVMDELQPIIDSHDTALQPIVAEIKTLHKQLQPEIREIKAKYMPDGHQGMMNEHGKRKGMADKRGENMQRPKGNWMAAFFLLMPEA